MHRKDAERKIVSFRYSKKRYLNKTGWEKGKKCQALNEGELAYSKKRGRAGLINISLGVSFRQRKGGRLLTSSSSTLSPRRGDYYLWRGRLLKRQAAGIN